MIKSNMDKLKNIFLCLILIMFCVFILNAKLVYAEEKAFAFNKSASFDIYYEVAKSEVSCLTNIKILDLVTINDIVFLHIQSTDFKEKDGYILFSIVKAILPSGALKPVRVMTTQGE
ncbi:MAG: hypothetical protein V1650_00895 [Candidatus Omnitrophota bacterium]